MVQMRYYVAKIPSYAVSYLENADPSGLEEEDIQNIDEYMEKLSDYYKYQGYNFSHIDWGEDPDPHFCCRPDWGLACNCYDAKIYYSKVI